jgi:hypothetical protein
MDGLQRSLPLGHGRVRWEALPAEVRTKVLELWVLLLMDHLGGQEPAEGCEDRGES